jgi:hypothetical protein
MDAGPHAACALLLGSTSTPSRKTCSIIHRPLMSAGPRLDYDSHADGLDRNELGALHPCGVLVGVQPATKVGGRIEAVDDPVGAALAAGRAKHH